MPHLHKALSLCAIINNPNLIDVINKSSIFFYKQRPVSLGKLLLIVYTTICLSNCTSKNDESQWDSVLIDSNIKKDIVYTQLDKQNEIFSELDNSNSVMKRTCAVEYLTDKKLNPGEFKPTANICKAYYLNSDTLLIDIGISTLLGGRGFVVSYKNSQFYTRPYFLTDVIYPDDGKGEVEPTYKIVYQKLVLDKLNYNVGDSLHGKVEFKSVEINEHNMKTEYYGKGYFRTKVGRP